MKWFLGRDGVSLTGDTCVGGRVGKAKLALERRGEARQLRVLDLTADPQSMFFSLRCGE